MPSVGIETTVSVDDFLDILDEKSSQALEIMGNEGKEIIRVDIEGTWDTNYPISLVKKRVRRKNKAIDIIWGSLPGPRGRVPFWLNEGTSSGFFIVSNDWVSKTSVARLRSGQGGGSITILPTRQNDGIKARNFDEKIANALADQASALLSGIYG